MTHNFSVTIGPDGRIAGLYRDDYAPAPSGAAAISFSDGEMLSASGALPEYELVNGVVTHVGPPLAMAQEQANAAIDVQAGQTRLKYITNVPGQPDTYTQKATDATNYKAAGYPLASLANYPWVQGETFALYGTAPTAAQAQAAADGILNVLSTWTAKGAAIEQQRRAGKISVGNATTVAAVQTALQNAIAALQGL